MFAVTLLGVAVSHGHSLRVALTGLAVLLGYKLIVTGFAEGVGLTGLGFHLHHEWVLLVNLFALLTGFALLARHFKASRIPQLLPHWLPDDWTGGLYLLCIVFVLSGFLDNIAAALIGGTVASTVFRQRVHPGYVAALVAAANAGGAGSVVGDTTTTMMWLSGLSPMQVLHAYVPAGVALFTFAGIAAYQQQRYAPITRDSPVGLKLDYISLVVVVLILLAAIASNVIINGWQPKLADEWPWIGTAVWTTLLLLAPLRAPDWRALPSAAAGAIFLMALVLMASLMPVDKLPAASLLSTFALGWVSAVFDNIPLTKLALEQGGYDWGLLAYAVGFGGSMMWFGSSAGVALCNEFPQARDGMAWLRYGWYVVPAYVTGFAAYVWWF
ncbi:MAG: citrate transporter [Steroidobacteraceae bacterium]